MDVDTRRSIAKTIGPMLHRETHRYAVALVDFETFELGSGTLVSIGPRTFVSTAGHVLPGTIDGRLFLLGKHPRKFADGMPAYLNHAAVHNSKVDVGFVEIDRSTVLPLLGKESLPLSLIGDLGAGDPKMMTAMTGFPGHTVGDPVTTGKVVPQYWGVNNVPIAPVDYPTKVDPVPSGASPPDPDKDVFLDYVAGDIRDLLTYTPAGLPKVHGMSGGGYYNWGTFPKDGLWSPGSMRLYAIQSSWCDRPTNPYVRATQIVYWLKLVADNYPDLRTDLLAAFPRIASVTF